MLSQARKSRPGAPNFSDRLGSGPPTLLMKFVIPCYSFKRCKHHKGGISTMRIARENRRDDFAADVARTIALRVGTVCSNPECRSVTSGPQEDPARHLNIGVAAHITAAAPGGQRYDPSLTSEQRRSQENGIWLCQNCHKRVDDDVAAFPADLLCAWKTIAEREALSFIGRARPVSSESEAQRKLRKISPWIGKSITKTLMNVGRNPMLFGPTRGSATVRIYDCDDTEVTIGQDAKTCEAGWKRRIPLTHIELSYDDVRNCLKLLDSYS